MPNYRRAFVAGGCWFFTVNLFNCRSHLLVEHIDALREAVRETRERYPFQIDAMVVLPDHIHAVWTLPDGDFDSRCDGASSRRASRSPFPRENGSPKQGGSEGNAEFWQRRFWKHLIRDERDYAHHVDYCWFNPVKHGLVASVEDWPFSSFHREMRGEPRAGDFESFEKMLAEHAGSGRSPGYGERDS